MFVTLPVPELGRLLSPPIRLCSNGYMSSFYLLGKCDYNCVVCSYHIYYLYYFIDTKFHLALSASSLLAFNNRRES